MDISPAGFAVAAVVATISLVIIIALILLPISVAEKRNHSSVGAIKALAWLGLITGGITWIVALVWAFSGDNSLPNVHGVKSLRYRGVSDMNYRDQK
jgi:hypothetical protein